MDISVIKKQSAIAAERYESILTLRALASAIPVIGGPLDVVLSGFATRVREERLRQFLEALSSRMEKAEKSLKFEATEPFLDVISRATEEAVKAGTSDKRRRFANIIANAAEGAGDWSEAEVAVRLMGDLEDIHIEILTKAVSAPSCAAPFDGLRVIVQGNKRLKLSVEPTPLDIDKALPNHDPLRIRLAVADLLARQLLYDEGVGRTNTRAATYFVSTALASWLLNWIRQETASV